MSVTNVITLIIVTPLLFEQTNSTILLFYYCNRKLEQEYYLYIVTELVREKSRFLIYQVHLWLQNSFFQQITLQLNTNILISGHNL